MRHRPVTGHPRHLKGALLLTKLAARLMEGRCRDVTWATEDRPDGSVDLVFRVWMSREEFDS
jgi:hypothetical protein